VVDGTVDVVSEGHWKLFAPTTMVRPCAVRAPAPRSTSRQPPRKTARASHMARRWPFCRGRAM
jgi:hypothetical protein